MCPTLRPSNRDYSARHTLSIIHPDAETRQWATVRASFTFIALPKYSSGEFNPFRRKLLQVQRSLKNENNSKAAFPWELQAFSFPFHCVLSFHFLFLQQIVVGVGVCTQARQHTHSASSHPCAEWQDCCRSAAMTSAMLGAWHVCTNARGVITSKYTVRKVV